MMERTVNINVRFPESVRDRVKAMAIQDRRSMNSEILELLEEAISAREARRQQSGQPRKAD
jgi:predicted HicB family RNase H-like nuclease